MQEYLNATAPSTVLRGTKNTGQFKFNKTSLVIGIRQNIIKYYNRFVFNDYIIDLYNVLCLIYVMFIYLFIYYI